MEPNPIGIYVPCYEVFPNTSVNFSNFKLHVDQLSRTESLFLCARINSILLNSANNNEHLKQEYLVHQFFTTDEIIRINEFSQSQRNTYTIVFFRGQLLELMRWICLWCEDHADDGITFEEPETRRRFAKAALMASDLWGHRIYRERFALDGGIDLARRRLLGSFRAAAADTASGIDPLLALGRGYAMLSNYISSFYSDFLVEFHSLTHLSLEAFYACMGAFMTTFLYRTPENMHENPGLFHVETVCESNLNAQPLIESYIALESQTADELRNALWDRQDETVPDESVRYDYKPLRRRPILRASDDRAVILDPVFYAERASVGPLFLLLEHAGVRSNRIFSAFGYAFEKYASSLLRNMYPDPGPGLVNRLSCNVLGWDRNRDEIEIADACLNNAVEVILFEMKAVWVRDDLILDDNDDQYLEHLRNRYGVYTSGEGNRSVKGVGQIARSITKLANREWTPLTQDFGYPLKAGQPTRSNT
ncbi:hypothetical protein [Candidatus Entotheonella palauensis]|uniref:hypothetical protein n=1 Tax=Candidatus Entotheonella palauensis TaxID=93172 RepID=UPI000B7E57C4|nr:hypothetical protein [Candidatus Entotheonella palauensis]